MGLQLMSSENEISWATLTPLRVAYWVFILKYSWNILNTSLLKNLLKYSKFSSHYYAKVYIKNLLKICYC
jgi:hypothetical protein